MSRTNCNHGNHPRPAEGEFQGGVRDGQGVRVIWRSGLRLFFKGKGWFELQATPAKDKILLGKKPERGKDLEMLSERISKCHTTRGTFGFVLVFLSGLNFYTAAIKQCRAVQCEKM